MKNMKNKELLVEVNRIKEMMGLLTEGIIDDGTKKLLKVMGYSNEWIDNLANKSVSDINFSNVADVLASSGIRSYDNLVANASEAFSKQTTEITADEIFAYLINKLGPEAIDSINKKIALSANEVANKILKKKSIMTLINNVDPTMVVELKGLLDAPLTGSLSKSTNQLNNGLSFVRNLISAISSKGKTVPDDLINLEKQFTDKMAEQDKLIVSGVRPKIDVPFRYTADELAAQALAKQELEQAILKADFEKEVTEAVKALIQYKNLSPGSKKTAMSYLKAKIEQGKTQEQILEELRTQLGKMFQEDSAAAEIARNNSFWRKNILPWYQRRMDKPIPTIIWSLFFIGAAGVIGFREQLRMLIQGGQEVQKELDRTKFDYENTLPSFQDFLRTSLDYTREEAYGAYRDSGKYYDKKGKEFEYSKVDLIFLETGGSTPNPPPKPPIGGCVWKSDAEAIAAFKAVFTSAKNSDITVNLSSCTVTYNNPILGDTETYGPSDL